MVGKISFVVLFVAVCFSVYSQNTYDFEYRENNGSITITRYTGETKDVVIPRKLNWLPVTAIAQHAFGRLASVKIPNGVTEIERETFYDSQLTSITIGNSVTRIKYRAFASNKLTSVVLPDSVTDIENEAFAGNPITSIVIGQDVKIGQYNFDSFRDFYYYKNQSRAGHYTYKNKQWSFEVR